MLFQMILYTSSSEWINAGFCSIRKTDKHSVGIYLNWFITLLYKQIQPLKNQQNNDCQDLIPKQICANKVICLPTHLPYPQPPNFAHPPNPSCLIHRTEDETTGAPDSLALYAWEAQQKQNTGTDCICDISHNYDGLLRGNYITPILVYTPVLALAVNLTKQQDWG